MTITLPLPDRKLSPNARVHWRKKCPITKRHRALAWAATREALGGGLPRFAGYSLAFYYGDACRRDDDNAEASCKAYRDGIAQALGIDDHELPKVGLSFFTIDRENPRLEITLHP